MTIIKEDVTIIILYWLIFTFHYVISADQSGIPPVLCGDVALFFAAVVQ
jgi:hypothetical protein